MKRYWFMGGNSDFHNEQFSTVALAYIIKGRRREGVKKVKDRRHSDRVYIREAHVITVSRWYTWIIGDPILSE